MSLRNKVLLVLLIIGVASFFLRSGASKKKDLQQVKMPVLASTPNQDLSIMKGRWNPENSLQGSLSISEAQRKELEEENNLEEEEDSEITKNFIFATPLADISGTAASSSPVAVLVKERNDETSSASLSEDADDSNTAASIQVLDALRELENLGANRSTLIGGMRVRSSSASVNSADEKEGNTEEEDEDDALMPHYSGQARGFMILPLMQPNAREAVEKQIETIIRAQLINVYLSFIVDGSFSTDFEYASSVVQRLGSEGRNLTMQVFFVNGPVQRKMDSPIETYFSVDPLLFRSAIQESPSVQAEYKKLVNSARPLFVQNKNASADNKNIACVMLEDNLDLSSYKEMRSLTYSVLGDLTDYVRNPCPGCTKGSNEDPGGDGLERHDPSRLFELGPRDGLVLDGVGYNYPLEAGVGKLSYTQVLQLAKNSAIQGSRYFALWRAGRQGLGEGGQGVHPDDRIYEVPNEEEIQLDIQILQAGLTELR